MGLNPIVDKVEEKGAIKVYGKRSLSIGEIIFLAIAIVLMALKGGVDVKNKWVILSLLLIVLAFIIW